MAGPLYSGLIIQWQFEIENLPARMPNFEHRWNSF
jgi:hypothetical protein